MPAYFLQLSSEAIEIPVPKTHFCGELLERTLIGLRTTTFSNRFVFI